MLLSYPAPGSGAMLKPARGWRLPAGWIERHDRGRLNAMPEPSPPADPRPLPPRPAGTPEEPRFEPGSDPVIELYKRDVDRTLLVENLRRTHDERARRMQAFLRTLDNLRGRARRDLGEGPT